MLKTQYTYQITVNFDLTNTDFELLTEAMENHSDTERYTKQGEFWYGNINRYNWRKDKTLGYEYFPPFSATTRQMGLVMKSLEPYLSGWIFDKVKHPACNSLACLMGI